MTIVIQPRYTLKVRCTMHFSVRGESDLPIRSRKYVVSRYPRAEPMALIIQASLDLNPDVIAISHTQ